MVVSSEKFQFLATDQRQEWQYRQPAEDLETEDSTIVYAGLRFVSRREHLFPQCFGTFSISSFPFSFFSENNLKIVSTWLPEKWQILVLYSEKYKPHFELPENSVLRLHKA